MKHTILRSITICVVGLLLLGVPARPVSAQTLGTITSLTNAITDSGNQFVLASTSGVTAGTSLLFIPLTGELMAVQSVPVSGTVRVRRGIAPTFAHAAPASAVVMVVRAEMTRGGDIGGACTRGTGNASFLPQINLANGDVWVCRADSLWWSTNLRPHTDGSAPTAFTGDDDLYE